MKLLRKSVNVQSVTIYAGIVNGVTFMHKCFRMAVERKKYDVINGIVEGESSVTQELPPCGYNAENVHYVKEICYFGNGFSFL